MSDSRTTSKPTESSTGKPSGHWLAALGQVAQEKALGITVLSLLLLGIVRPEEAIATPFTTLAFGAIVVSLLTFLACWQLSPSTSASRRDALQDKRSWYDRTTKLRFILTAIATGSAVVLLIWTWVNSQQGSMPGGVGSLLVLSLVISMAWKLALEMYLLSWISGTETDKEQDPRHEQAAQMLIGRYSGWTKVRYVLGALGGVTLPLGAQILASGAKNIPAAVSSTPSLMIAVLVVAFLIPGEIIARSLFYRITEASQETDS